jgi:hypothetical protein
VVCSRFDAGVHARVRHKRDERAQRQGDLRLRAGDSGRERKGGRRVSGCERPSPRHSHMARAMGASRGTPPPSEWLERRVRGVQTHIHALGLAEPMARVNRRQIL